MKEPDLLALLKTKGYTISNTSRKVSWSNDKLVAFRNFFLAWEHAQRPPLGTFRKPELFERYEREVGPLVKYSFDMKQRHRQQKDASHGQDSPGEVRRRDVAQQPSGDGDGADAALDEDWGDLPPLPLHD